MHESNPINAERSPDLVRAIMAYNRAHRRPTYCIVTSPTSKIGGFSCELLIVGEDGYATVQIANGDVETYPLSYVTLRVEY